MNCSCSYTYIRFYIKKGQVLEPCSTQNIAIGIVISQVAYNFIIWSCKLGSHNSMSVKKKDYLDHIAGLDSIQAICTYACLPPKNPKLLRLGIYAPVPKYL